jgi:IS1 family transposase
VQVIDNEHIELDEPNDDFMIIIENNDLLINELYSKERGRRVEYFGIQLDEMWTFVGNKDNKQWLWLALNPYNRQIIAFHVGSRSSKDAKLFYEKIPDIFKGKTGFFSDYWQAYVKAFEQEDHFGVGKDSGLTSYIERFNCTLRQRSSRLTRLSLSFSKSLDNHIGAIKYFICHYNLKIKALHL